MNRAEKKQGLSPLQIRQLTYAALYLAIAMVLPFVTGQVPEIGSKLLPMHIPALLCGFMCGWKYGLVVGFIAPLLRSVTFGMPPMIPEAVAMAFELAVYGGMSGWLRRVLPGRIGYIYAALLLSMIAGRIAWAIVRLSLAGLAVSGFSWKLFMTGGVTKAIPGIILQLAIIPVLVTAMEKAGLSLNVKEKQYGSKPSGM